MMTEEIEQASVQSPQHPITTNVNLTDSQLGWAEDATDGLVMHFESLLSTGEISEMPPLPSVEGTVLILTPHEEVIADLLYRLEEQADALCQNDEGFSSRAAHNLAKKIRKVTGFEGLTF